MVGFVLSGRAGTRGCEGDSKVGPRWRSWPISQMRRLKSRVWLVLESFGRFLEATVCQSLKDGLVSHRRLGADGCHVPDYLLDGRSVQVDEMPNEEIWMLSLELQGREDRGREVAH